MRALAPEGRLFVSDRHIQRPTIIAAPHLRQLQSDRGWSEMNLSHLDWPSIIVTAIFASIGAIAGMAIKQWLERSLEEKKVRWERASWVHQRQVEALTKLFVALHKANELLLGATRLFKLRGEIERDKYLGLWVEALNEAWATYIEHKLLLPKPIDKEIDTLFRTFTDASISIGSATMLMEGQMIVDAASERKKAAEIARKQIPSILDGIEIEARKVIHEELT